MGDPQRDTIFALSSGRPPAAIGIIRMSGPEAHAAASELCGSLPPAREFAVRTLRDHSGEALDEALVLRFDGARSATGEDSVEFHCHGGRAILDQVLAALGASEKLRLAEPGEFTRRAFDNGKMDLIAAEGLADLLVAETEAERRAAQSMIDGHLARDVDRWRNTLVAISAELARAIDYVGEEEEAVPDLAERIGDVARDIEAILAGPRIEQIRDGHQVVLAGPPNSGKSSLFNALLQVERAIVSEVPGTTRDVVDAYVVHDGLPFALFDTAGIRETPDEVEKEGVVRAIRASHAAHTVLWLGAADDLPNDAILISPKADLGVPSGGGGLAVSSLTRQGVPDLWSLLAERANRWAEPRTSVFLNRRHERELTAVAEHLRASLSAPAIEIQADQILRGVSALDRLTGRSGLEDIADSVFSKFCLGK